MGKMELEVKILDVDKKAIINKLEALGAKLKDRTKQYLYTYDLSTIYGRYIDVLTQLNEHESDIKYETALARLKLLFFEIDNLLDDTSKQELDNLIGVKNLSSIIDKEDLLEILNKEELISFIDKYHNNSKKWIRVRQTNDVTTIAVKHILANNDSNLQQMLETEIEVPSILEANNLLEALGFSYKSYQEKERITYILDDYEIDIDSWPGIPTYFEIEGKSERDLDNILKRLDYSFEMAVSCTADQVYERYGKSMFDKRELKFEDYE